MRFLREFKQKGTIFFVSHDTQAIQSLCDRAALISSGRLVRVGDAREISEMYLEDLYADQQPVGIVDRADPRKRAFPDTEADVRQQVLDRSTLRNEIEVFEFDLSKAGFGAGGALIREVILLGKEGERLTHFSGGEIVTLEIRIEAKVPLDRPIVGFYVKNRLGQFLFGDNTFIAYRSHPVAVQSGESLIASFRFRMPILPPGEYFITPAVANGTQEDHVQHHWIHEALMIQSVTSSVTTGLVGIPMASIDLTVEREARIDA
jgi:lipopolysaccharide transport system ATP-binding protein